MGGAFVLESQLARFMVRLVRTERAYGRGSRKAKHEHLSARKFASTFGARFPFPPARGARAEAYIHGPEEAQVGSHPDYGVDVGWNAGKG